MSHIIELDGQIIPVTLKWNALAKQLILRLNPKGDGLLVTLPKGVEAQAGLEMAKRHKVWIANQLSRQKESVPFQDGAMLPFMGKEYRLRHAPELRGTVWQEGDEIIVAGKKDFFERRLMDWLKKKAKSEITPIAHELAARLGKKVNRISVRDTVSRWGSCSSQGNLSLNWRLIFAPPEILRYVIAHEVAHLKHMDHSPAFWQTVNELGVDAKKGRGWLRKNGPFLQKIGS